MKSKQEKERDQRIADWMARTQATLDKITELKAEIALIEKMSKERQERI